MYIIKSASTRHLLLKQLNLQSRKASQQSFWRKAERDLYAEAMSEKIEDFRSSCPDLIDRPFALQTFSNNGLQTWAQISHNFEQPKGRSTVTTSAVLLKLYSAVIMDSGPTLPTEIESFPIPGRIFSANNPKASGKDYNLYKL